MRFLILDTDYPEFLRWLYSQHAGLKDRSYAEQIRSRAESLFGLADFYSSNLCRLGHEAWNIYANNECMQTAWAMEQGMSVSSDLRWRFRLRRGVMPWFSRVDPRWFYDILKAQIKHYKPDILLNQDMHSISSRFLSEMKPYVRLLVGQHAATRLPDTKDFRYYDLVVSSFPPTVQYFQRMGVAAVLHQLAFEPRVLSCLGSPEKHYDITFIGSLQKVHSSRVALLEALSGHFPQMRIWGPGVDRLPRSSRVRKLYMGQAWGREMFEILSRSRATLNHHGDVLPFANNMRLYEATGVGTLLITDWKANLREMFEPGKEVITYRTAEECEELAQYYLEHDDERQAIARAGQQRTLNNHTYYQRMQELVNIVERHLCHPEVAARRVFV